MVRRVGDFLKFIEGKEIEFEYSFEQGEQFKAIDKLSITIKKGEFICIIGHNGSGKSTLAKHFNALLTPTKNNIYINNIDSKNENKVWEIRKSVGMIFQNPDNQIVSTTVESDIAFGLENLGILREEMISRINNSLELVKMSEYKQSFPSNLSGGQKQKVAIAGILAMMPQCIVFDEATSMLDPISRDEVLNIMLKLNRDYKITIILITHHMEEVTMADRAIVMEKGKIVLEGEPKKIFSEYDKLKSLNLDLPQITKLSYILKSKGFNIKENCLNIEQFLQEMEKINFYKIANTNIYKTSKKGEKSQELNENIGLKNSKNSKNHINLENVNNLNGYETLDKFEKTTDFIKSYNKKDFKSQDTNNNSNLITNNKSSKKHETSKNLDFYEESYYNEKFLKAEKLLPIKTILENSKSKNNIQNSEEIINIKNLNYTYSKGSVFEKKALNDINISIKKAEILSIIGQTGSGKSTLIQHLNLLIQPKKNKIFFHGKDICSKDIMPKEIRQKIGIVFQYPETQIFEDTIFKDVSFAPKNMNLSEKEIYERVKDSLEFVGMDESFFNINPFSLSGGQKRLVAIAGILAMKPEVIVFDEPTAGLDPKTRELILNNIIKINKKTSSTVIIISHSMEDVCNFSDRVAIMHKGSLSICDTPKNIFNNIEKIAETSLKLPQVTELFFKMNKLNKNIPKNIINLSQAVEFFMKNLKNR